MSPRILLSSTLLLALVVSPLSGQDTSKPKPDSAKMGMMDDHMMSPWKEMNAFHRVMGATWHPASQKNDLSPLRARARDLLTAADAWVASKAPAMPASCASEPVRAAAAKVAAESKALVTMIESGADDARLKVVLKGVHDAFEVAEKGCAGHGEHGRTG